MEMGKEYRGKIVFDIDNTICNTKGVDYRESTPNYSMIEKLNNKYNEGYYIILQTARGTETGIDWKELTEKQLKEWGVLYHKLMFQKAAGDIYIDDKACNVLNYEPDIDGEKTDKIWGEEYLLIHTDSYVMKRLKINPGKAISYQYHNEKDETWHIVEGSGIALVGGDMIKVKPGTTINIPHLIRHTVRANEQGLVIIESSTTQLDDIVRLQIEPEII